MYALAEKLGHSLAVIHGMTIHEFDGWLVYFEVKDGIKEKHSGNDAGGEG